MKSRNDTITLNTLLEKADGEYEEYIKAVTALRNASKKANTNLERPRGTSSQLSS